MPKTRISCPNCRQPVTADVDQLFDVAADPSARQRLLSGTANYIQCPTCGYQGTLASPLVYHDPDKELLLTFVPPELGLPRNEQERIIGSLINQVVNNLPQERRKAYLLRPQATLTMQGLVERVLEAEGITKEMIQAQQQRLNLIQRLANASSEDVMIEMAKQEDSLIDEEFFGLLRRLVEASVMGGDRQSAQALAGLQEALLPVTTFGQNLQAQQQEIEAAVADLRAAGRDLNREKLLELILAAPNETRMSALVGLARPVMDYQFFQLLSERVDQAQGDEKQRMSALRETLLEMTRQIDQQVEAQAQQSRQLMQQIMDSEDIGEAMMESLPAVDEFFIQELNASVEQARRSGDLERLGKLQKMVEVLQQVSSSPPEVAWIEELLDAPDDGTQQKMLEANPDRLTPDFLSALSNLATQVEQSDEKELGERISNLYRTALRVSMRSNLSK